MSSGSYQTFLQEVLDSRALLYQGVRKIVHDLTWHAGSIPKTTFESLGYGSNKQKQMTRNYIDESELTRIRSILDRRKEQTFTSVAMSMRGKAKDSRSQGWCINSIVVSRTKDATIAEIQYRSTELVLKFGGDLCFLPSVFDRLGIEPDAVRFRFANAYLSGVYFPYVCTWWEPIDFLSNVRARDTKLFEQGTRFFLRSAYREDQVFPYSPENVAHRFAWKRLKKTQMKRIRDYLESEHKKFGKPLPKLHYREGEYVPRGQRRGEEE